MEADPAELRAEGTGELAAHLRSCPRCRAVAAAFLREAEALEAVLAASSERLAENSMYATKPIGPGASRRRVRGPRRIRWRWAAPLAAAAALAAALLLRSGGPARGPGVRSSVGGAVAPTAANVGAIEAPLVRAPSARHVMIFKTDDPNITIIWLD